MYPACYQLLKRNAIWRSCQTEIMLTTPIAKTFFFSKGLKGFPNEADVKFMEETLPEIKDGEYLAEAVYVRVNPNPQMFANHRKNKGTFPGTQIAKIIESKNERYPVGKFVVGNFGWRTLTIAGNEPNEGLTPFILPEIENLPKSLAVGVLGLPGYAAHRGLFEICKPKEGNIVVVSSAAGCVGSTVGQLAKLKGCTVIGITSSDEKGSWLTNELGFDHHINYKTEDVQQKILEYAPNGVDCYFDNVGGDISSKVIYNIKPFSRICICGATSLYFQEKPVLAYEIQSPIKVKMATMEGMLIDNKQDVWLEAVRKNLKWIREGKLKYKETVIEGIENIAKTFVNTLRGDYIGNVVIKV